MIQESKRKTRKGEAGESSCAVYVLPVRREEEEELQKEQYKRLEELKEFSKLRSTDSINLLIGEDINVEQTRKMAEYVFLEKGPKIKLLAAKPAIGPKKSRPRKEEGLVTVKAGNGTYADLVRKLKEEVDIGKIGVTVKKIWKTVKGDLQLQVEDGDPQAETLESEIKNKIEEWEVCRGKQSKKTIFVLGLDITTKEADVQNAVLRATDLEASKISHINVKSLKSGRYGEQTAIVEMPRLAAIKILNAQRIKVGWLNCSVREMVNVVRCFNCLEYGHFAKECKATENKRDNCMRCGQKGHRAKECQNAPFCISFGIEGHRADQIKSPLFKKEVDKARKVRDAENARGGKTGKDQSGRAAEKKH